MLYSLYEMVEGVMCLRGKYATRFEAQVAAIENHYFHKLIIKEKI